MGHENRGIVVAFRDGIWGAGVAEEKGFPLYNHLHSWNFEPCAYCTYSKQRHTIPFFLKISKTLQIK